MALSITTIIAFLGIAGYLLARHIHLKKKEKKPLVCPLRSTCSTVVTSGYSKIGGVPLEKLGMMYYGATMIVYGFLAIFPGIHSTLISFVLMTVSAAAFLLSIYLICVQAFALRAWCTWCLMSAFLSTMIFALSIFSHESGFETILREHKTIVVLIHALAATIGVGTATLTDIFFFRFLGDKKISIGESGILATLSNTIWVALGALILSGLGLYLISADTLNSSPKFLVKMIGVGILFINGVILNLVISPKLVHISFGEEHEHMKGELTHLRKWAFALGAVSISSWYMIFILGNLRKLSISFWELFGIYFGVMIVGVIVSLIFEHYFTKKKIPNPGQ